LRLCVFAFCFFIHLIWLNTYRHVLNLARKYLRCVPDCTGEIQAKPTSDMLKPKVQRSVQAGGDQCAGQAVPQQRRRAQLEGRLRLVHRQRPQRDSGARRPL